MSHPETPIPYVCIDHHGSNKDYFYEILFQLSHNREVYLIEYPYELIKSACEDKGVELPLSNNDIVVEHTYNPPEKSPHNWERASNTTHGTLTFAKYRKPFNRAQRIYVMAHPDSSPSDKEHDGTIHWPSTGGSTK